MEQEYKFFSEKYNKILDLIEVADSNLADKYKNTIFNLPKAVIKKLQEDDEFECFAKDFQANLNFDGEMLEFDYTRYGKYLDVALRMYPIYEEEISNEIDEEFEEEFGYDLSEMNQWFIFSLTISNVKGVAKLRINYKEEDGKYVYVDSDINGIEIDYQSFVENRDGDYFIVITKYLNGHELYKIEKPIEYEELLQYSSTWDDIDCEDDDLDCGDEFN